MRTPALPPCLAFVAGILVPVTTTPVYAFVVATLALGGALLCAAQRRARAGTVLVAVGFVALGAAASALHERAVEHSMLLATYHRFGDGAFATPRLVVGELRREPETRSDVTLLSVDVDTVVLERQTRPAAGGLRVSVRGSRRAPLELLRSGDRLRFWATVREPSFFRNPGAHPGARRLETQHIDLLGSVKSGLLVNRIDTARSPVAWISDVRRYVLVRLAVELDPPERGVVAALVTGDRVELSPELVRQYQRAGIFHVMAISGAHVGIWIAFVWALARWAGLSTRTTLLCLVAMLPLYAVFCGARPPVVRAVSMALLLMGGRLSSLRAPSENALAIAAMLLLAWEPSSLFDAGFQLTMAAMATIVVFYDRLVECLNPKGPLGSLAKPVAVSIAAQLGVIPIAAWHFHRLTPGSPVASLAAIPLAGAICVLGVVLVLVSGLPVLASLVSAATSFAVGLLNSVAELTAALPLASIRVGAPSALFLVVYAAALAALLSRAKRVRVASIAVFGMLLVVALVPRRPSTGVLEVDMLDVGHGDAILLTLPEGGHVLVDGGGLPLTSFDVGEAVVLPYLLDRGVRRLDAVVVTHADFDHIGGLATIVAEMRVDEMWQGHPDARRSAYRLLRERAVARGVPIRTLVPGERFELGGVDFEILAAGDDVRESSNNRSVVLRVRYAGRNVLFTGDAEAGLERHLVHSGQDLRADVLKIAHHGSRSSTSTLFLDAVQPEIAIVSARRNRSRPIPSDVVLRRLQARGIDYARTDRDGMVTVRIHPDGRLEVSTYLQSQ